MAGKYKYLLKNMGLMTISNFTSKILAFLLVPLYTNVLSTKEYGIYDLYATTAFLMMPLLTVCISEAVLRFSLDKTKNPSEVISVGFKFNIRACIIITLMILVNYLIGGIQIFNQYPIFFLCYFYFCLFSETLAKYARGIDRVFDTAVAGILSSVTTIVLNILFLLIIPLGIKGFFIATISAFAVSVFYLTFRLKLWREIRIVKSPKLSKEMTAYSSPLIFNQLAWWINNVSDRYVVTWICGAAANGIYSVAYKIPSVLAVFQTIFNQAWTLSAVKELKSKEGSFYSNIYRMYNCAMVILCSLLIAGDRIIAKMLFAKEFYAAWKYAPFLIVSVVFGSMSGLLGGIYTASKDSKIIAKTTIIGAILNVVLNIVLVYLIGPIGAAIATLVSYVIVWEERLRQLKGIVVLKIKLKRDIASYVLLIAEGVLLLLFHNKTILLYSLELLLILLIVIMYWKDILETSKQLISKYRNKQQYNVHKYPY